MVSMKKIVKEALKEAYAEYHKQSNGEAQVNITADMVSQSTNYNGGQFPASNGISSESNFTHTNSGIGQWWKVNFSRKYNITKIRITNRQDQCGQRIANTQVLIDNEFVWAFPPNCADGQVFEIPCNKKGTEIKLLTVNDTYLHFSRFEVFASDAGPSEKRIDIQPHQCSQSGNYNGGQFPASNGLSTENNFSHTNEGLGEYWKVNFNQEYLFTRVRVRNRFDQCGQRIANTHVMIDDKFVGAFPGSCVDNEWFEFSCKGVRGREIKLKTVTNTYLHISGFEAYALM